MSEPPIEYQIGDIANGYIWTGLEWARHYQVGDIENNYLWNGQEWVPVTDAPPAQADAVVVDEPVVDEPVVDEPAAEAQAEPGTGAAPKPDGSVLPPPGTSDFFAETSADGPVNVTPAFDAGPTPIYRRWWFWVAALALLAVAAGAFALSQHQGDEPRPGPVPTSSISPSDGQAPSPSGSSTPSPTGSATATVTPSPSGTGIAQITARYGTFAPVTSAGTGSSVVNLPAGSSYGMVTAISTGSGVFAITELAADNTPTGDLLVDTSGPYSGTTAYGLVSVGAKATKLKIDASGPWHLTIAPLDKAPTLALPAKGGSNAVYVYLGPAMNWKITHTATASSNFSVVQYAQMPNLLVNAIGNYNGTVPVTAGPTIITIDASGPWTFTAAP
mgnify:CR=1 FL=1